MALSTKIFFMLAGENKNDVVEKILRKERRNVVCSVCTSLKIESRRRNPAALTY